MDRITSASNPHIRGLRELERKKRERDRTSLFVIEGLRAVREIPDGMCRELLLSESFLTNTKGQADTEALIASAERSFLLPDDLMARAADTEHPQGILAVSEKPHHELRDIIDGADADGRKPLLLVLQNIQDPGNLGTMIRTAEGAGATGLIVTRTTADVYQPKTVRSTMGSIFRVPVAAAGDDDLTETIAALAAAGIRTYAAWLRGSVCYDSPDYRAGSAFLIGNEGNGLLPETAEAAAARVRIPMAGKLESLNAAMSAGILLYEAARQRRN